MRVDSRRLSFTFLFVGVLASLIAEAGPRVVEETASFGLPDPAYALNGSIAVDGDYILAAGYTPTHHVDSELPQPQRLQAAFLFQRGSNGTWNYVTKLVEQWNEPDDGADMRVAMKGGIAAVTLSGNGPDGLRRGLVVFERGPAGWVNRPATGAPRGTDLEIDAGTIVSSDGNCSWDADVFRRNTAGQWVEAGSVTGAFRGCGDGYRGGDVDVSGTSLIVSNGYRDIEQSSAAYIYEGPIGAWTRTILTSPSGATGGPFGFYVTLQGDTAVTSGEAGRGSDVFRRTSVGNWSHVGDAMTADALLASLPLYLQLEGNLLVHTSAADGNSVAVFQRDSAGEFVHAARLIAKNLAIGRVAISGRRVVATGAASGQRGGRVAVFDLPSDLSQPSLRQEDFQSGSAASWTPLPGSSFSVATTAASRVYRQSSLVGNAAALLTGVDWNDQSIQADVRPTAFDGSDRWFGLVTRYTDANNYYYVAARSSNVIQLRKMANGVFTTLASASLPIALNAKRNLRLEAVGSLLRVYVDDTQLLQARDSTHTHGQTGLMMYKTRADYDNVIVSPTRRTTLYEDDFSSYHFEAWENRGTGQWSIVSLQDMYQQTSVEGGARAVTPIPTGDQIVQARAMATSFGSGAGRWFGIMARYQDDNSYYYVTVRNDNTIALRKLVNGAIVELDLAPLTVTTNTWYTLRLEAIGTSLRVYVNGQLTLEAQDSSLAEGSYGLVMYKAATRYSDFLALQP